MARSCRLFAALELCSECRIRLLGVRLEGLLPKAQVHRQMVFGAARTRTGRTSTQ
jgi:hypothetical protein